MMTELPATARAARQKIGAERIPRRMRSLPIAMIAMIAIVIDHFRLA